MEFLKNVWTVIWLYFFRIHGVFISKVLVWQLVAYGLGLGVISAIIVGWYILALVLLLILGKYLYD